MELAGVRRRSKQLEGGICPAIESIELWCCIKQHKAGLREMIRDTFDFSLLYPHRLRAGQGV